MPATMRSTAPTSALMRNRHPMSLVLGLFLGQGVLLMAHRDDASWLTFGLSTVFVAAASAAFVLFVLSQQRLPVPRGLLSRQAHLMAGLIGVGLLLSLRFSA
ncbi:MAG: hypothetical protein KF891_24570 [Rhizobacter sp.]|nr:hypothetical protein [Rhizobacter sp.]